MYNQRKQIQQLLDGDYNTKEKVKINAEVFTPFDLIEEMLNNLSKDVWSDPNKTWLDPAAGLGNFHCVVLERLLVGLTNFESNEEKRYKHIIENQLYFIELNPRSAVWIRRFFNPGNTKTRKYKMNLVCADHLDDAHPGWDHRGFDWEKDDILFPTHRYYRKKEVPEIRKWLEDNYSTKIKSVSFLLHKEHGFSQPPLEEISKEQYEEMEAKTSPILRIKDKEETEFEETLECTGTCPIK